MILLFSHLVPTCLTILNENLIQFFTLMITELVVQKWGVRREK